MDTTKLFQLWAGLGFSVVLVGFFIVAFFWSGKWEQHHWALVRFLASLCSAFAAALFTGSALVDFEQTIGQGGRFAFQGAAGFALFFVVWYFFPKYEAPLPPPPPPPPPPDDGNLTLLSGMTFEAAVRLIAQKNVDRARGADFKGFDDSELKAPVLSDALINLKDGRVALLRVRDFTGSSVGPYRVRLEDDRYQVERES